MVTKEEALQELKEKKLIECVALGEITSNLGFWNSLRNDEKEEISDAILENIKKDSKGWTIKEENLSFDKHGGTYILKGLILIHQSAQIKYSRDYYSGFDSLYLDSQRMFASLIFTKEQWIELKKIFNYNQSKQSTSSFIYQKLSDHPILYGTVGMGIIGVIVFFVYCWLTRKKNSEKD